MYSLSNTLEVRNNDSIPSYQIDAETIRYANLIFAEHSKLILENKLLYKQIDNYKKSVQIQTQVDSIKNIQVKNLYNSNLEYQNKVSNLENLLNKKEQSVKYWKIGGITVTVCLLVFLLCK